MRAFPWVRVIAGLFAAVLIGALVLFAGGNPAQQVRLLSGSAWLPSSKVGQATLLDGSTTEVAAQVPVAPAGNVLEIVQQGSTGYVVDKTAGTVRRIDGGTFDVTQPAVPIPDADAGLTAFAGAGALYAMDIQRGIITAADPRTGAGQGSPQTLAAQLEAGTAVVDDTGRLWIIDTASGTLTTIRNGSKVTKEKVAEPGRSFLTLVGNAPVIVNTAQRKAITIDPDSGEVRGEIAIELRPDDSVQVSGSPSSGRLYLALARGVLNICTLPDSNCDRAVPLSGDLGTPVEAGDRLFVPDYSTGEVWIIDLTSYKVTGKARALPSAAKFQLLNRDGVVFFNEPLGVKAGVIQLDGTVRQVDKYNPGNPSEGVKIPQTQQPQPGAARPNDPAPAPAGSDAPTPPDSGAKPDPAITLSTSTPQVNEEVTLSAKVSGDVQSIDWDFGDGGTAKGSQVQHRWGAEQTFLVTVTVTMKDGRTAPKSLNVVVSAKPVARLTVKTSDGGSVSSEDGHIACPANATCTFDYDKGATVKLTAAAKPDFGFTNWTGACGGTGACTVQMAEPQTVNAGFHATAANITVAINDPALGSVMFNGTPCTQKSCTKNLPLNSPVTLEAQVKTPADYEFEGWTAPCGTAAKCDTTASGTKTITAKFKRKEQVTLTLTKDGDTSSKFSTIKVKTHKGTFDCLQDGPCVYQVNKDTQVVMTPVDMPVGWLESWSAAGCPDRGQDAPCTVTMTKSLDVVGYYNNVH